VFSSFVGWVRRRWFGGAAAPPPSAPPVRAEMHYIPEGARVPLCGAPIFRRWTVLLETVTCPECVKLGARAQLRRRLSVR
jgi:hypothetical protein